MDKVEELALTLNTLVGQYGHHMFLNATALIVSVGAWQQEFPAKAIESFKTRLDETFDYVMTIPKIELKYE